MQETRKMYVVYDTIKYHPVALFNTEYMAKTFLLKYRGFYQYKSITVLSTCDIEKIINLISIN